MPEVDLNKVVEEAYTEFIRQQVLGSVKKRKNYGKLIEAIAENVMGFFGLGVLVNTFFLIGSGQTIQSVNDVIGGSLVMVFLALGFGLGFARGYRDAIEL